LNSALHIHPQRTWCQPQTSSVTTGRLTGASRLDTYAHTYHMAARVNETPRALGACRKLSYPRLYIFA
jgi:hypothetical protein